MASKKIPEETIEEKYDRARRLEASVKSLLRDKERGEIYQKVANLYASLGDFQDAKTRSEQCEKKAKDFQAKYKQQEKERKDAEKKELKKENPQKKIRTREIILALLGILIVALGCTAIFLKTKPGRYFRADFFEKVGYYEKSYKMFYNLKDYKDSEDRYKESYYEYANGKLSDKEYEKAKSAFRKLEDYKASEEKLTEVELAIIEGCKIGEDALFGEYRWMILEKDGDKVFLVKLVPINGVSFDRGDAATWEDSSVRKYLNGEFKEETFNEVAQKHILTSKVEVPSKLDKLVITEDQLFFLTAKQADEYQEILSNYLRDWWLIDQGENAHTEQFVSRGVVMEYGYEMSDENIFMRPAMWITLK